jgi:pimeloyl-ACP methyl ester carboxylesterase
MIEKKVLLPHGYHMRTLCTENTDSQQILLAVHGWLDNVGSFIPLLEQSPKTCCWHLIDLLGHGHSQWKAAGSFYYFHDYINDVIDYIETLEGKNLHLLGHSMGASIVSMVAGLLPDKISSCVLLDGLGPLVSDEELIAEQWRLSRKQYKKIKPRRYYPSKNALIQARQRKHHIEATSCELLVQYGYQQEQATGEYYWSFDPRLLNLSPLQITQQQALSILKHIACPTLLINANEGYPLEGSDFEERKAKIENIEEIQITGHHHVHMDNPQLVWQYINSFYKKTVYFNKIL